MFTPVVDGRPLTELVTEFESRQGHSPAGDYAGLVPDHFRFGNLARYFLGQEDGQWPKPGYARLLGCDCGEVGCWPLEARIIADPETVAQPDVAATRASPTPQPAPVPPDRSAATASRCRFRVHGLIMPTTVHYSHQVLSTAPAAIRFCRCGRAAQAGIGLPLRRR
jgi:hypothetical protein